MFEPKPIASLSSSLLARKGDARPAIRRAYVPMASANPAPIPLYRQNENVDLGWNDMGEDSPPTVHEQQKRIVRNFPAPVPAKAALPEKTKAKFTLRLEAERHLRLRLASAVAKHSSQQLLTAALDAYLDALPGLDALVEEAKKVGRK